MAVQFHSWDLLLVLTLMLKSTFFLVFLAYLEKKCLNLKQDADLEDTRRPFFCSLVLNLRVPLMLDPVGGASPRARSHVGLLINEHAAAGQGSVQFALLRV